MVRVTGVYRLDIVLAQIFTGGSYQIRLNSQGNTKPNDKVVKVTGRLAALPSRSYPRLGLYGDTVATELNSRVRSRSGSSNRVVKSSGDL